VTEVLTRHVPPRPVHALPRSPWLVGDAFGVAVVNLVGIGLILGGLQGARQTTDPHTLLLLLNVAAGGLVVSLAGNAVFLLSALRHVGTLRTELLGTRAPAPPEAQQPTDVIAPGLVSGPSMTRFHRAGCPAAQGKPVTEAPLAKHLGAGRQPCALCDPTGGPA
jgi:hypothetical protein